MEWRKCSDCKRILQIQIGFVCPDCLSKRAAAQNEKPQEAAPVAVRRGRKPKEVPHG